MTHFHLAQCKAKNSVNFYSFISRFTLIVLETENFGFTTLGTGGVLGLLENILSAISSIFSLFVTGSFDIVLVFAKARTKITLFIISFCNLLVNRDLPS